MRRLRLQCRSLEASTLSRVCEELRRVLAWPDAPADVGRLSQELEAQLLLRSRHQVVPCTGDAAAQATDFAQPTISPERPMLSESTLFNSSRDFYSCTPRAKLWASGEARACALASRRTPRAP